jgi:hypothetical protein
MAISRAAALSLRRSNAVSFSDRFFVALSRSRQGDKKRNHTGLAQVRKCSAIMTMPLFLRSNHLQGADYLG